MLFFTVASVCWIGNHRGVHAVLGRLAGTVVISCFSTDRRWRKKASWVSFMYWNQAWPDFRGQLVGRRGLPVVGQLWILGTTA
jgi:hypothetical protein